MQETLLLDGLAQILASRFGVALIVLVVAALDGLRHKETLAIDRTGLADPLTQSTMSE